MSGTNNLSQMINKRFLSILVFSFVLYLLPELFFGNVMVHIMGGVIGGTLKECLKFFIDKPNDYLLFSAWVVLLMSVVVLCFRLRNKLFQFFTIGIIAILLYVVDFIFFTALPDTVATTNYYLISGIRILSKSLILSVVFYYGTNQKKVIKSVE